MGLIMFEATGKEMLLVEMEKLREMLISMRVLKNFDMVEMREK